MGGIEVTSIEDYSESTTLDVKENVNKPIDLPKSNVLKYHLPNGYWFCLRPSGTEPKSKFYFGVKADTLEDRLTKLDIVLQAVMIKVNEVLA